MKHSLSGVSLVATFFLASSLHGQTVSRAGTPPPPSFDIVSVHKNVSGRGLSISYTPDGFTATNVPVQWVVVNAYKLRDPDLMIGGKTLQGAPSWVSSDRYDIQAKMSPEEVASQKSIGPEERIDQIRAMLQTMLKERFQMKVRYQTITRPCYALVLDKGGSKMHVSQTSVADGSQTKFMARLGLIEAESAPLSRLVFALAGPLHCTPQDKTGLTALYDFTLKYSPDPALDSNSQLSSRARQDDGSTSDDPSLFSAIKEQLGLKLIHIDNPTQVIFVEHIERPSEN